MQEINAILEQARQRLTKSKHPLSLIVLEWDGDSSGWFLCLDAISIIGSVETANHEADSRVKNFQDLGDLAVKLHRQIGDRLITYVSIQLGTFTNCRDSVAEVKSAVAEMAGGYGVPVVFTNEDFNMESSWWDAIEITRFPVSQEQKCI